MDLARAYLLARQGQDGLWRDFLTLAGESTDWTTGYIAAHLRQAGAPQDCLDRAALALLKNQQADNGWGYHAQVPSDGDSTAYVLLFLAEYPAGATACRAGTHRLLAHQDPSSGGIATYQQPEPIRRFMGLPDSFTLRGWCQPHAEVTAAAGRALVVAGGNEQAAERAWHFVRGQQQPAGSWLSYWWTLPHYPTFQAVALAQFVPQDLETSRAVERAVNWILETQRPEGGWAPLPGAPISGFATALAVATLVSAGYRGRALQRGADRLRAMQQPDGSWTSHPILRIPHPELIEPARHRSWQIGGLGTGVVIRDQHHLYTTATCLGALVAVEMADGR